MKQLIAKIWKDPVWSKVISVGILALIGFIWGIFSSWINQVSLKHALSSILTLDLPLWLVTVATLLVLVLSSILKKKAFLYDATTLDLDKEMFDEIRPELLPQDGSIDWLRHVNFYNSFKLGVVDNY